MRKLAVLGVLLVLGGCARMQAARDCMTEAPPGRSALDMFGVFGHLAARSLDADVLAADDRNKACMDSKLAAQ